MRKALLLLSMAALGLGAAAQPYGNEWIHYDRPYWAFKIWQDGVRRIDSTALVGAGFPLQSVDPRTIQLYARGRQVPIHVEGEQDGVFNSGDFIEFYAAKNDAWLDSTLWDDPAHISNPYYSLYNDTIRYFLTWGDGQEARRMVPLGAGDWAARTPLAWCWGTTLATFPVAYQTGNRTPRGASLCVLNEAEGYFGNGPSTGFIASVGSNGVTNMALATPGLYAGADASPPSFSVSLASLNNPAGDSNCPDHHLLIGHGGTVHVDTVFKGYKLLKFRFDLPPVTGTSTTITYTSVHDLACAGLSPDYPDAMSLAWHSLRYPRDFAFGAGLEVQVPGQAPADSTRLTFAANANPVVYAWAPGGLHRIRPVSGSGAWQAVLPPSQADMRVRVTPAAGILPVTVLAPVNGTGYFNDPATGLADSALVIVTHPSLMAAAQQYAQYRQTNPHNRYNTILADVEQLYDQFAAGVRQHPLAIRNYLRFVYQEVSGKPRGLFLIGKSVQAPSDGGLDYQRGYRKDALAAAACLVPSIGWPCSDLLFGLDLTGTQPADLSVPVGRLAARTPDDVLHYLAKVDSVESQPPAAWMKNILHFRGGFTDDERLQFDNALYSFQVLAEDTSFFGHVTKFTKNGAEVIEQAAIDSVSDMIANGVTLMTFFAHAYGGGFDITIDVPENYDWHGKFPVVFGNSCYTGNLHRYDAVSTSERFVLHENAGALAFISSSDLGLSSLLAQYCREFYKSFSQVNYGGTLGDHMRHAAFDQLASGAIERVNNAETIHLHGDPLLVMNSPALPDLEVTQPDVRIIPEQVTAELDSFKLQVVFRNIGRGTHQPFSVAVARSLVAEGITLPTLVREVQMSGYQDTVTFTLPVKVAAGGVGLNDLHVRLDLDPDLIGEVDDMGNNQLTRRINISPGDLLPVQPYNFAIVPDLAPVLRASTGDPFAPVRNYIFQIDTTDRYDSPVMEQGAVQVPGGVVEWQPASIYALNSARDSVVFFWRCSLDSTGQGGYNWHEFSFQHITGRAGWGQAHFFQFKDNGFNLMAHDRPDRRFDFFGGNHQIACEVKGGNFQQNYWFKDNQMIEGEGCGTPPALHVAVVDPFDFEPWLSGYNGVGRYCGQVNTNGACRSRPEGYFIFRYVPAQLESMAHMLADTIPDGSYVLVYTYLRLMRSPLTASPAALEGLASLGAVNLTNGTVPDGVPYIFFCKKGDPSSVQEIWGDTPDAVIYMSAFMNLSSRSGSMQAPRSSTALGWEGLSWQIDPVQPGDSVRIHVDGVAQGTEFPLLDMGGMSGDVDLSTLAPAANYPQLRLKGSFWNDNLEDPRPAQIRRWQLLGVPAPECAIDPPAGFHAHLDSIFQGQQGEVMVAVRNIGQQPMDSLLMTAWVTDRNNQAHRVHYRYNAPMAPGAVLRDTIRFNTQQFPGPNSILIEANPVDTATGQYDQPEQYHFNNIAQLRFLTMQDMENPVLDITFDGMHILDGDIVSAQPEIQITLQDENQTLLLDQPGDTAYFQVFLTGPSGENRRIYFRQGAQEVLQFVPATGPDNLSKVFYHPDLAQDGKYRLSVRATDKSRNASGDRDNSVNFEVINRPTITEVLNYPNPFTTSTRFVFTLTGREVPTAMRIQIMTITGRVVREVSMAELGPLRVGRNVTAFAWDGTDQFGDRLARGVYLYRVMAQLHGQDIEYRDGGAGSYFRKGIGKMYLLR